MPVLKVSNVHKSFGKHEVLRGISLDVEAGQVVAVVGPSGSGKSTFLRLLNGLERFDRGEIWLGPLSMRRSKDLHEIRKQVGMVFQQFNLFSHLTAGGNIMLAQRRVLGRSTKEAEDRARALLERVGLADKWSAYPSQLSGGQQQRVAIARALAMDPRVMLFDEATSALDPELIGEVLDVMRGLADSGMTMLVVTHEMNFAHDVADRVLFMDHGVVLADGPPSEVLGAPKDPRVQQFLRRILER